MVELTIPTEEANAIFSLDSDELRQLINDAIRTESAAGLQRLSLERCGSHIAQKFRGFECAVIAHQRAKAARKREQTERDLRKAAQSLSHAVEAMKRRLEKECEDAEFFYINDLIMPPDHFTENLSVTIQYRWRKTTDDDWSHGRITFTHTVEFPPDHLAPKPKRKPSKAMLERERQNKLSRVWERLMSSALYTLRDYFRDGHDGAEIPVSFEAVVEPHSRSLNNYSTDFWRERSG